MPQDLLIDIDDEVIEALSAQALDEGCSLEDLARRLLTEAAKREPDSGTTTEPAM